MILYCAGLKIPVKTTSSISPWSHRNILQSYIFIQLGAWLPYVGTAHLNNKRGKKGRQPGLQMKP